MQAFGGALSAAPGMDTARFEQLAAAREVRFRLRRQVGQPRDGDWRASYALWDIESQWVALQRVEYPVKITQRKIAELDYPSYLADRLSLGE